MLDRANHTGFQSIASITDLQTIIDSIQEDLNLLTAQEYILNKNIKQVSDAVYVVDKSTDFTLLIDCSTGNKIVVLPDASQSEKYCINIKKVDNTANTVTIYPADWEDSISGSLGFEQVEFYKYFELSNQGESAFLQAYSNNYYKI